MSRLHNRSRLKALRRALRHAGTPAEATLWKLLQRRQLHGRKFRRQHSIGAYIVDFYCPDERLVVELDGSVHDEPLRRNYDEQRTHYFEALGIRVVRFANQQVFEQPDVVCDAIAYYFEKR